MNGRISFIGAGPGAADLITVRGARRIAEADVVVWTASLVAPECIQEHARNDAELIDSSRLTHEHAVEIFRRAERDKLNVARVHSGDPSLWGGVQGQHDACARMDLEVEIVPGVAAFSAAAAAVGRELTVPEVAQSVVVTRLEGGDPPMPERERVREFAKHGTTMALFLSASRASQLVDELRDGGYPEDVPVLVAYKVSWPDEIILRTTLGELEQTVKQHKLWRNTLFLVGRSVGGGGARARTYAAGQLPAYRRPAPAARRAMRAKREGRPRRSTPLHSGEADSSGASDPATESVPEQRTAPLNAGQRDSDVAWWAVRNWQDTARGTSRTAASRPSTSRRTAGPEQPDLFVADDTTGPVAEEHADVVAPVADSTAANAESVQDGSGQEGSGQAEPGQHGDTASTRIETTATSVAEPAAAVTGAAADSPVVEAVVESVAASPAQDTRPAENDQSAEDAAEATPERTSERAAPAPRRTSATRASAKAAPKSRAKPKGKTASGKPPATKRKTTGDTE